MIKDLIRTSLLISIFALYLSPPLFATNTEEPWYELDFSRVASQQLSEEAQVFRNRKNIRLKNVVNHKFELILEELRNAVIEGTVKKIDFSYPDPELPGSGSIYGTPQGGSKCEDFMQPLVRQDLWSENYWRAWGFRSPPREIPIVMFEGKNFREVLERRCRVGEKIKQEELEEKQMEKTATRQQKIEDFVESNALLLGWKNLVISMTNSCFIFQHFPKSS